MIVACTSEFITSEKSEKLHRIGFNDIFEAPITDEQIKEKIIPQLKLRDEGLVKTSLSSQNWKSLKGLARSRTITNSKFNKMKYKSVSKNDKFKCVSKSAGGSFPKKRSSSLAKLIAQVNI